jgi:cytidine deaminase
MIDANRLAVLFDAAAGARARAYAPYSDFAVGAAALGSAGGVFAGCNVENAAYPVGTCAEAAALSAMVVGGETRLSAILVLGGGERLCTPCGACRQRIREFAGPDAEIIVAGPESVRRRFTLEELLPESFGPETLADARP